jgi:signal transduction histidine kinase
VLRSGQPESIEEFIAHSVHGRIHVDVRFRPVLDAGRVTGVAVISVDVTESVRQREQLRAQATLLSMMREAVVLLGRDWVVRLSNPAFDTMLGAGTGSLQGANIRALMHAAIADIRGMGASVQAELERNRLRGYVTREFDWGRPDGRVLRLIGTFTPVDVDGEDLMLGVYLDVTQERLLERRILDAAALEQRRLGTALHDGLGQELTGIALLLRSLSASVAGGAGASRDEFDEIIGLVNQAIDSSRRLARGFAPVSHEQGGLRGALHTLAESMRTDKVQVTFDDSIDTEPPLAEVAATHLLRIAQEAVANAIKHAAATFVSVKLERGGDEVVLTISDNGRGFPEEKSDRSGFGIETMRYRVEALRGQIEIISDAQGVTIRCRVPVH